MTEFSFLGEPTLLTWKIVWIARYKVRISKAHRIRGRKTNETELRDVNLELWERKLEFWIYIANFFSCISEIISRNTEETVQIFLFFVAKVKNRIGKYVNSELQDETWNCEKEKLDLFPQDCEVQF